MFTQTGIVAVMRNSIWCVIAVLGVAMQSSAVHAEESLQANMSRDKFRKHVNAAGVFIDEAKELVNKGQLHDACMQYGYAQKEYAAAIWLTNDFRDPVAVINMNDASELVSSIQREVCNKKDTSGNQSPSTFDAPNRTAGSSSASRTSPPDWADMSSQVAALQSTIDSAYGYARESSRLYSAHDLAGSCIKARASAEGYLKARAEAAAILKASGSFHDVGLRDIQALDENVAQSGRDAEEYYCKPLRNAIGFQAEIEAFVAMINALHLERGTVTPMTSDQAVTMLSACVTDKLYAATKARSVFAQALSDGCQSFTAMYNMLLPSHACSGLSQARLNLAQVEPEYVTQGKKLRDDLAVLQDAYKCNGNSGLRPGGIPSVAERNPERGALSNAKAAKSDLPPMKLDIKPIPVRAGD